MRKFTLLDNLLVMFDITPLPRQVNARILLANSKVPKFVYPTCLLGRQKSLGN